MKTLNKKIFLRYPIALAASIVALAGEEKADYSRYAQLTADYYNALEDDCTASTTGSKMLERPTDQQLQMIMKFAHQHLGMLEKSSSAELGKGTKIFEFECSKGQFRLVLVEENNQIISLQFQREELAMHFAQAA